MAKVQFSTRYASSHRQRPHFSSLDGRIVFSQGWNCTFCNTCLLRFCDVKLNFDSLLRSDPINTGFCLFLNISDSSGTSVSSNLSSYWHTDSAVSRPGSESQVSVSCCALMRLHVPSRRDGDSERLFCFFFNDFSRCRFDQSVLSVSCTFKYLHDGSVGRYIVQLSQLIYEGDVLKLSSIRTQVQGNNVVGPENIHLSARHAIEDYRVCV